jgi:hypothetical protein
MVPEFAELESYRLASNWTWAQLATEMADHDVPMSPRTLHYLVKSAPADAKPHDRTLYKIRVFLKKTAAKRQRLGLLRLRGGTPS